MYMTAAAEVIDLLSPLTYIFTVLVYIGASDQEVIKRFKVMFQIMFPSNALMEINLDF